MVIMMIVLGAQLASRHVDDRSLVGGFGVHSFPVQVASTPTLQIMTHTLRRKT